MENFNTLVERALSENTRGHMRPVIEKELLHFDILFALDKESLLDNLVFQGGTALRLCYGGNRYSEDLDFVGNLSFNHQNLIKIKECIEDYVGARYGLKVDVKEPKNVALLEQTSDITVDRWQVRVTSAPKRKDLPKQCIKIEIVNIPAYTKEIKSLIHHYDFLPDGYDDLLIETESLEEIFADKIVSFTNCEKNIRHRDLWDLRWMKQKNVELNLDFIAKKIKDYRIEDFNAKLNHKIENLETIIQSKAFSDKLTRFLPKDVQERTIAKSKFLIHLYHEMHALLTACAH